MPSRRREEPGEVQALVEPQSEGAQHTRLLGLRLRREGGQLASQHPELSVLDFVLVREQPTRWRARSTRAIGIVDPPMTGTQKQARRLEPAHRATEMRAIDRKHLKLLALQPPHPAGDVGCCPVPG